MNAGEHFLVAVLLPWYRQLLHLYPLAFSQEFGEEMEPQQSLADER